MKYENKSPYADEIERLAATLEPLDEIDGSKFWELTSTLQDCIDLEAIDALSYNGCEGDDAQYDGHGYLTLMQGVGQFQVLRVNLTAYYRGRMDTLEDMYETDENGDFITDANGYEIEREDFEAYWPEVTQAEVVQFWFCPDGSMVTRAVPRKGKLKMIDVSDCWSYNKPLKITNMDCSFIMKYKNTWCYDGNKEMYFHSASKNINSYIACIDWMKHGEHCDNTFFNQSLADRKAAVKAWGYKEQYQSRRSLLYDYEQIFLAHRNNIDLNKYDADKWSQLLWIMEECGNDLQNVAEFCPENLDDAIEFWKERSRKVNAEKVLAELEKAQRMAAKKIMANEDYIERRKPFLAIRFDTDTMEFEVLQNLEQFAEEGIAQGHCVFSHEYYKFPDAITMTCRDKITGKRISTVTVDVEQQKIIANLGKYNTVPRQEVEIENIVMEQMPWFVKANEEFKKSHPEYVPNPVALAKQRDEWAWNARHEAERQRQRDAMAAENNHLQIAI